AQPFGTQVSRHIAAHNGTRHRSAMHTLFGSGIGRKPRPSSVWWESSQELIDRVRQIEHAEPERHRDQESIDPARNAVDSPQEKSARGNRTEKPAAASRPPRLVQAGRSAAKAAPLRSGLHSRDIDSVIALGGCVVGPTPLASRNYNRKVNARSVDQRNRRQERLDADSPFPKSPSVSYPACAQIT